MRQQEIENVQLRSELRTLARNEDLARIEASVSERVQTMVSRSPPPLPPESPRECYMWQVGKALEHDSDSVASLVEQNSTMRRMWQEDRGNLFKMREQQLDLQKAMDVVRACVMRLVLLQECGCV